MAYSITEDCISCTVCMSECPNEAIFQNDDLLYEINPELCTECVGSFEEPQCKSVCPVEDVVIQNQNYFVETS